MEKFVMTESDGEPLARRPAAPDRPLLHRVRRVRGQEAARAILGARDQTLHLRLVTLGGLSKGAPGGRKCVSKLNKMVKPSKGPALSTTKTC